MNDKNKVG